MRRDWRVWGNDLATQRIEYGDTRYKVFTPEGGAAGLRRDGGLRVTSQGVTWEETELFIARERYGGRRYELYLAGGHPSGCALRLASWTRLAEAISGARHQITRRREQADA